MLWIYLISTFNMPSFRIIWTANYWSSNSRNDVDCKRAAFCQVNSKAMLMFSGLLGDGVHENIFWPDLPYVTDEHGSKLSCQTILFRNGLMETHSTFYYVPPFRCIFSSEKWWGHTSDSYFRGYPCGKAVESYQICLITLSPWWDKNLNVLEILDIEHKLALQWPYKIFYTLSIPPFFNNIDGYIMRWIHNIHYSSFFQ